MQRKVVIKPTAPPVSDAEIADLIAYHITGGDPTGYLDRLLEQQKAEQAAKEME